MRQKDKNEDGKKEISLLGLFGAEALESLQDTMHEATGFYFSVIDYKGDPVIDETAANDFCTSRAGKTGACAHCRMETALAAARSVINHSSDCFCCPMGLLHFTVPIVVNNQYLGALVGGRIRCAAPENIPKLAFPGGEEYESVQEDKAYRRIPESSYEKTLAFGKLAFRLFHEMGEKESALLSLAKGEHAQKHLKDLRSKNASLKETMKEMDLESLRARLFPQTLLNFLVVISSFAILENAPKTEEIAAATASVLRYYVNTSLDEVAFSHELEQIENYLKILCEQYGDRLHYRIQCQEKAGYQMIPALSIFPFVEYIMDYGVMPNHFRGTIYLDAAYEKNVCRITIQFDNSEYMLNGITYMPHSNMIMEESMKMKQLEDVKRRFFYAYGNNYSVSVQPNMVSISLPGRTGENEVEQ